MGSAIFFIFDRATSADGFRLFRFFTRGLVSFLAGLEPESQDSAILLSHRDVECHFVSFITSSISALTPGETQPFVGVNCTVAFLKQCLSLEKCETVCTVSE